MAPDDPLHSQPGGIPSPGVWVGLSDLLLMNQTDGMPLLRLGYK